MNYHFESKFIIVDEEKIIICDIVEPKEDNDS